MTDFITAISAVFTSEDLWSNVTQAAPFIGLIAVFVFGYYIVRKVIKGAARGKLNF